MRCFAVLFACAFPAASLFAEIAPGDPAEAVRRELGAPNGLVAIGQTEILFFDRGEVVLRDGYVMDTNLLSESELIAKKAQDEERRDLLARIAEQRRGELEVEGLALKQAKIDSPGFQALPASERVAYWKQFQARYPMVSVDLELSAATAQAGIEETERNRLTPQEAALVLAQGRNDPIHRSPYPNHWLGWTHGLGVVIGRSCCPPDTPRHRPGCRPGHRPVHPIHPGRPPGGWHRSPERSDSDFRSTKGSIMADADRARGRIDAGYSASRAAIYRSITP